MTDKQKELIFFADSAELSRDLPLRNKLARKLLKSGKRIEGSDGESVETIYDRQSGNYVTYKNKSDGDFETEYTGNADDAAVAHFWAARDMMKPERPSDRMNPPKSIEEEAQRAWRYYTRKGSSECDSIVCTVSAAWIRDKYFKGRDVKIVGYSMIGNPRAIAGHHEGGHDFLLIDGRYIVDFWWKDLYDPQAKLVLDLGKDKKEVKRLYGTAKAWEVLP